MPAVREWPSRRDVRRFSECKEAARWRRGGTKSAFISALSLRGPFSFQGFGSQTELWYVLHVDGHLRKCLCDVDLKAEANLARAISQNVVPQERARALWAIPEKEKFKVGGKQKHHSPLTGSGVAEKIKRGGISEIYEGFPKAWRSMLYTYPLHPQTSTIVV